jgi:hypothetical protein
MRGERSATGCHFAGYKSLMNCPEIEPKVSAIKTGVYRLNYEAICMPYSPT